MTDGPLARPVVGGVVLELVPVADPLAGPGAAERPPDLRLRMALKRLLRDHGWRCKSVMQADRVEVVTRQQPVPGGEQR